MGNRRKELRLRDLVSFKTGKLDSNAAKPDGEYPFFTCSQQTLRTNTYSFDTECVLLAGNNANGIYPLKYYSGKFNAYQRTYVIRSLNTEQLLNRYLFYALRLELELLKSISTGAATKFLTLTLLNDLKIKVPELSEQERIVNILSAYDDLIDNNTQRINILQEMAQSLYREWFIHFRFPDHENSSIADSPFGKIPGGWNFKPLEKLISECIGGGWGKDAPEGDYTERAWVIRGTDIPKARTANLSEVPCRFHTRSNLKSRKLMVGDIVFEVSGGSKGQPVGRTLLITEALLSAFDGDVMCASFCKRIVPEVDGYGSELLYLSFVEGYTSGEIEEFQVQSTGISNFKWTDYSAKTLRAIPPTKLQRRFRELVAPTFKQIATLGLQAENLRRTRDLLLPKLISGQINLT